jgi:hypothetical protein
MGIAYLITGILVPILIFIAWKMDQKDEESAKHYLIYRYIRQKLNFISWF